MLLWTRRIIINSVKYLYRKMPPLCTEVNSKKRKRKEGIMKFYTGKEWLKNCHFCATKLAVKKGAASDTLLTCNYQRTWKRHDAYVRLFLCVYVHISRIPSTLPLSLLCYYLYQQCQLCCTVLKTSVHRGDIFQLKYRIYYNIFCPQWNAIEEHQLNFFTMS